MTDVSRYVDSCLLRDALPEASMYASDRIEAALERALSLSIVPNEAFGSRLECPPKLAAALRYSLFPGGGRFRPRLCLAVAMACGEDQRDCTDAAAAAIEILHCASLVHDDLPCFDNAATRRGKPSVHRAFGERLAVLSGDALIVLAFQVAARGAIAVPERLPALLSIVGESVGAPGGIAAGQAWECESTVSLAAYQQSKTGALFAAATMAGAVSTGADPAPWRAVGLGLGEAYQVADDLHDAVDSEEDMGKPVRRDEALGRPSAAIELGIDGAVLRLNRLLSLAADAIPPCRGADGLRALIAAETSRLLPKKLRLAA
jgi:geranylgeranyl diphosphate synthase, type II